VNEHEYGVLIARIAEHIFEIEYVALTQAEIIADADRGVKCIAT